MNKQGPNGIEWTDRTWNPVGGCKHACRWQMPDGQIARCYAENIAEGVARAAYPHGFEHHYWNPDRLDAPAKLKTPSRIFLDSMSDLMGAWVPDEQIQAVLDVCHDNRQHQFQLLTKNAPRLSRFTFPANVWVGISSPPDFMMGKRLSIRQQEAMLHKSLTILEKIGSPVRWMSFEPLSWDVSAIVEEHPKALNWAVIGAASNGRQQFPPDEIDLRKLLLELDINEVPVFFKGNLRSLPYADRNWREDMPTYYKSSPVQQELL